jgi:hypothetical protein
MTLKVTTQDFITAWNMAGGSPTAVAKITGLTERAIYGRRKDLERRGVLLKTVATVPNAIASSLKHGYAADGHAYTPRLDYTVKSGCVIVSSDHHYWPGDPPFAHKALVILTKRLKPKVQILNGDVLDGARISRHEPLGWQALPTVIQELDACKTRTGELERASPTSAKFWTLGNHCTRYDRRLATEVSEFEQVPGMRLEDHFKAWKMSYSVMLNSDLDEPVMVKHAMRGGIHAIYNNTLHAGVSIVTGHLHAQLCRPFTDYRGTRYGVDCGTVAEIDGPQFSYTLDGPVNWRSGFAVLTFDDRGRLMPPELCEVQRYKGVKRAVFRGEIVCEEKVDRQRAVA